jgi:hypothetical protein
LRPPGGARRFRAAETRANLSADLEGVKAQLGLVATPLPRPSKLVEQALRWEPLLPDTDRRATRDCTRFVGDTLPDPCKKRVELRKELAAATEYERLSRRAEELRLELRGLGTGPVQSSMARSFDLSLGRLVKMDGKDGIAIMAMLILTLTSAFGPFGLYLVGRAGKAALRKPAPASRDGEPAQGQACNLDGAPPKRTAESAIRPIRPLLRERCHPQVYQQHDDPCVLRYRPELSPGRVRVDAGGLQVGVTEGGPGCGTEQPIRWGIACNGRP